MQLIRWLVKSDLGDLEQLESREADRWTVDLWRHYLRDRMRIAFCAEFKGEIVGAMMYEQTRETITLLRMIGGMQQDMHRRLFQKIVDQQRERVEYQLPIAETRKLIELQELGYVPKDAGRDLYTDEPIVNMVYERSVHADD